MNTHSAQGIGSGSGGDAGHEEAHLTPGTYIKVGVILTIITIVEFAIVYIDFLRPAMAPLLIGLSIWKFWLVAQVFMHLKVDSPVYRRFFAGGIALALGIGIAVLFLSRV